MDAFFLSLFLPFGQENDFRAKAFSRACQAVLVQREAALGLEQFSLTLSEAQAAKQEMAVGLHLKSPSAKPSLRLWCGAVASL